MQRSSIGGGGAPSHIPRSTSLDIAISISTKIDSATVPTASVAVAICMPVLGEYVLVPTSCLYVGGGPPSLYTWGVQGGPPYIYIHGGVPSYL